MKIDLSCPACYWRLLLGQRSIDDYDLDEHAVCPVCGAAVRATVIGQGGRQ
jgi:hypothetical protein